MLLLSLSTIVSISTEFQFNCIPIRISNYFYFLIFVCIWYECVYVWMQAHGCHSVYVEVRGQSWMSVLTFHLDWDSLLFFTVCTQCLLACELLVILFLPPFCCRSTKMSISTTMPGFTWVLGFKFRSSYLQGKHFPSESFLKSLSF